MPSTLVRLAVVALCFAAFVTAGWAAPESAEEPAYVYTVGRGDTLIGLGRRLLLDPASWSQLVTANAINQPNRLRVGTRLRVPLRLMASEPASAVLTAVSGDVRTGDVRMGANTAVVVGQLLPEGADLRTGDGSATVRLVDGTVLRLRPSSRLKIEESNRVPLADLVRSGVRVQQGQLEVVVQPAKAGQPGFRVGTPQGVLGVRGTEFRVKADVEAVVTRSEVLEGSVAADGAASTPGQLVKAGFGVVVDRTGTVAPPVRLLPAPDVSQLPALQEQPLVRFTLAALAGASAHRGQVSREPSFEQLVADTRTMSGELRFADLPDGDYILRLRGEDQFGLEGFNADHRFRLKARPEAPLPTAPVRRAVFSGDRVELAWTVNPDARSYRLQLSRRDDFNPLLKDLRGHAAGTLPLAGLAPGVYFWRLASERSATDQGPFGAAQSFELRALPAPLDPPQVGEQSVPLSWQGLPGQTFELQVARDLAFKSLVQEHQLQAPSIELKLPGSGRFYVRVRSRDADGFVGPYTAAQQFEIPNCLRVGLGGCVKAGGQSILIAR